MTRLHKETIQAHHVATAVFEDQPERQERLLNEFMHRHGEFFKTEGALEKRPAALLEAMAGMHDYVAKRTLTNPDTA
jgi:hypothetical protein